MTSSDESAQHLATTLGTHAEGHALTLIEPTTDPDPSRIEVVFSGSVAAVIVELRHPDGYASEEDEPRALCAWATHALQTIVASASVEALHIRHKPDYAGELDHQWLADALAAAGPLGLRTLSWGSADAPCFVELPDLSQVFAAVPELETLALWGEWEDAGVTLPATVERVALLALRPTALEAVCSLELHRIKHLELRLYDYDNEGEPEIEPEDLDALFARKMPALRGLTLNQATCGPGLVEALPSATFFGQLETLTLRALSDGTSYLPEHVADALLSETYGHLNIDVTGSFCDPRRPPSEVLIRLTEDSEGRIRGDAMTGD